MIRAVVAPEVVGHGGVGVPPRQRVVAQVARFLCHELKELKVHHVVYYHRELPFAARSPRLYGPHALIEAPGKVARALGHHVKVMSVARQPVAVAEAAVKHEAQVVGVLESLGRLYARRKLLGQRPQGVVAAVTVQQPQRAGVETAYPRLVSRHAHPPACKRSGQHAVFHFGRAPEGDALPLGHGQAAAYHLLQAFLLPAQGRAHGREHHGGRGCGPFGGPANRRSHGRQGF